MNFLGINMLENHELTEARVFADFSSLINWAYDSAFCEMEEIHDEAGVSMSKSISFSEKIKVVQTGIYNFDMSDYHDRIHLSSNKSGKFGYMDEEEFESLVKSLSTTTKSLFASPKPATSAPVAVSSVPNKGLWIEKFECWEDELEAKFDELENDNYHTEAEEVEGLIKARDLRKKAIIARASSSTPSSSPSTKGNWLEDLELWEDELDEAFEKETDEDRKDSISGAIAVRDGAKKMAYYDSSSSDDDFVKEDAEDSPEHKALEGMIPRDNSQKKSRNFKQNGNVFYPKDGKYEEGTIASLGKHQLTIKTRNGKFVTKDKMDCYVLE